MRVDVLLDVVAEPASREHRAQAVAAVLEQKLLRSPLLAEQVDVARPLPLIIAEQRIGERRRVRHGHRRERAQTFGVTAGHMPRDRRAPVVTDEVEAIDAQHIGHRDDIGHQVLGPVMIHADGTGSGRVAPLVGRDRAIAGHAERVELGAPFEAALREPVEEKHGLAACRSRGEGVEREPAHEDLEVLQAGFHA